MSKEDIDKAVKEAEQYAEDDKKKEKRSISATRPTRWSIQTEKTLKEMGDKLPESKSEAEAKLAES